MKVRLFGFAFVVVTAMATTPLVALAQDSAPPQGDAASASTDAKDAKPESTDDSTSADAPSPDRQDAIRETIEVSGRADELVGIAASAGEGGVGDPGLLQRPFLRPAEILETVPGVIITQHSGGGKANQYFLRGFNLDHGTDFRITVGNVPVNMPTHGHGQGYSDLNFLIPELVASVDYRKGPYAAQDGDFSAAGSARIDLLSSLADGIAEVGGGNYGYGRLLLADSLQVMGGDLLGAVELAGYNGPWTRGDRLRRRNALLRWSRGDVAHGVSVTGMGYDGSWNATDQIPESAVAEGALGRFDTVDPTTGGESYRYSLAAEVRRGDGDSLTRMSAFVLDYRLDLFSNFTYFLDDEENGDPFQQRDARTPAGAIVAHERLLRWRGRTVAASFGADLRADRIDNGLYHTKARTVLETRRQDDVDQPVGGPWAEARVTWTPWLRTTAGLRADGYWNDVTGNVAANAVSETAAMLAPKLAVVLGPWRNTELYFNAGYGFHSNDARGTTIRVDPTTGEPVGRVDPLVRATAVDLGLRTIPAHGLQSPLSVFALDLDSELLFVGDAGITEANRPSRRVGIELANFWQPTDHVRFDLDAAYTRARFRDTAPEGDRIPGAIEGVVSAGATIDDLGRRQGALARRDCGPRPLIEADSVRAASSTLLYAQAGYAITPKLQARVEIYNLLDEKASDIDYFYTSRLRPGDEPRDDVHFQPAEPRTVRLMIARRF